MSKGINKVFIMGNLGQDPEVRQLTSGGCIATLNIATSEVWKDRQTNEKKEKTEWHRVVFFGKLAEICGKYLKKGVRVYVEGKLETKKWVDKQGIDRWTTQIMAHELQMLGESKGKMEGPPVPNEEDAYHGYSDMDASIKDGDIPF